MEKKEVKKEVKETKEEKVDLVKEPEPEPNVAFAGKEWRTNEEGKTELLPSRFAPERVNTATRSFKLPPSEVQVKQGAKGFYHAEGDWLIVHFADLSGKVAGVFYKRPKAKGE